MGRPRGAKNKTKPKQAKDPRLEDTYETEIEFLCPIRGLVKQKVKIKKFKPLTIEQQRQMLIGDSLSDLEEKDDGLSIYNENETGEE
jgi:hypothetical protein